VAARAVGRVWGRSPFPGALVAVPLVWAPALALALALALARAPQEGQAPVEPPPRPWVARYWVEPDPVLRTVEGVVRAVRPSWEVGPWPWGDPREWRGVVAVWAAWRA
jgi:hypothetical protein